MSLELGQPADGDQAVSADEAEETRSPEETTLSSSPAASDASSTYDADSDVPDDSRYADDPDDSDEPDTTETADTSDAPDAADTSDAPDGIDKADAWDASEDSGADGEPGTPETADVYEPSDHEASDADPLADPGAPGTAEPSVLDDATDAPATGVTGDSVTPADEERVPAVSGSSTPGTPGTPVGSAARMEEAAGDLDGPLLGDAADLRTNWQQILAGFVDDPQEAVADAAGLVDHTAQALVGALQARQRLLRAMWDRDASADDLGTPGIGSPTGAHAAGASRADDSLGTEELRLLIQRYRTLFNDICPS